MNRVYGEGWQGSDPDLMPDCLFSSRPRDLTFTSHPSALSLCQVEQQSPYVQGFKVLYRPSADHGQPEGQWSIRDVRALREEGVVIGQLRRACVYEFKVRPFFDEFQGTDSEVKVARTLEEGKSASNNESSLRASTRFLQTKMLRPPTVFGVMQIYLSITRHSCCFCEILQAR